MLGVLAAQQRSSRGRCESPLDTHSLPLPFWFFLLSYFFNFLGHKTPVGQSFPNVSAFAASLRRPLQMPKLHFSSHRIWSCSWFWWLRSHSSHLYLSKANISSIIETTLRLVPCVGDLKISKGLCSQTRGAHMQLNQEHTELLRTDSEVSSSFTTAGDMHHVVEEHCSPKGLVAGNGSRKVERDTRSFPIKSSRSMCSHQTLSIMTRVSQASSKVMVPVTRSPLSLTTGMHRWAVPKRCGCCQLCCPSCNQDDTIGEGWRLWARDWSPDLATSCVELSLVPVTIL